MPDRPARSRPVTAKPAPRKALVASARILDVDLVNRPEVRAWQSEGWGFYDTSGELRDAISWLGNAMSRGRLLAARETPQGDEPEPLEDGLAAALVSNFAGGINGQTEILRDATTMLGIAGETYLLCDEGYVGWRVRSAEEVDLRGEGWIEVTGAQAIDRVPVTGLVVRAWVPHARRHWEPDSPVRAAIPILRELELLTKHVEASALSRLAGAGLLLIADEIDFPAPDDKETGDDFQQLLIETAAKAIKDRGSAAANVPVTARIPGDYVDKVKHIAFSTPFDDKSIELRDEARRRLATALDIPAEILLGLGEANHWTAWQIEESSIKLHIEPMMQTLCAALTDGFLRPTLAAAQASGVDIGGEVDDFLVWYDLSELTVRPDKSKDAFDLYDRLVIGDEALRRETGFDESDAPDATKAQVQLLLNMLKQAPSLGETFPRIFELLGIDIGPAAVQPVPGEPLRQTETVIDVPEVPRPADGPPARPEEPPAPGPDPIAAGAAIMASAAAADEAALVAASEALVHRALERAGNRVRSLTNGRPRPDCVAAAAPHLLHTCLDLAEADIDPASLLAGAWERVPELTDRYGGDADALTLVLNAYCHHLLLSGTAHDAGLLASALGPVDLVEA